MAHPLTFSAARPWIVIFFTLVWVTPAARAWNATGHMIVASLAYDQLPPAQRARWAELLRAHPDFDKWQAAAPKDAPDFDFGRYLFMRASTWPDDIRKTGSPWDHPLWHHIDYPLRAPDYPLAPPPADVPNALTAIAACEKTLADPTAPAVDRAASLGWLVHLIGDLQQPMHNGTVIDAAFPAPEGDHNGLSVFVSVAGNPITLHWLWDCLPGDFVEYPKITARGTELAAKFPRAGLPELQRARDPLAWSLEGRALAIEAPYQHGTLAVGTDPKTAPTLPPGYLAAARGLADRRVALGGYRLADVLLTVPLSPP